jgi:hypothetical protein
MDGIGQVVDRRVEELFFTLLYNWSVCCERSECNDSFVGVLAERLREGVHFCYIF